MGLSLNKLTRSREFMSEVLPLTFWSLPAGQWYSECYLVLSQAKVSRKAHGICQCSPLTFISQPYTFISQLMVILNTNHYVPILLSFPYNKVALLNIDPKTPNPQKLFPNRCTQGPQPKTKNKHKITSNTQGRNEKGDEPMWFPLPCGNLWYNVVYDCRFGPRHVVRYSSPSEPRGEVYLLWPAITDSTPISTGNLLLFIDW